MKPKIGVFQILPDRRADPAIVAQTAEALGFHSYWVPEHAIMPLAFASDYVGDPGNVPDYLWQMPDTWVALSRAAATTERILLGSGICLVPEHNPLLLAKQVASVDHYSHGRVLFGIGAGWNREESEILGVDFDHRWTQTRECVEVMRKLWAEDAPSHDGRYYKFPPLRSYPKPECPAGPPVMFGSSGSPRVCKRVVTWGQGWIPVMSSLDEFAAGCRELEAACAAAGRDRASVHVAPFTLEGQCRTRADRDRILAAGADEVIIWLVAKETAAVQDELHQLAEEMLD
ncbi:MAG: LLM class F420-dependent oxidoreductase [Gammaproteobacteria bacterium]|nr:LLM class F420-dependent oxidoreductase [Gammaproteobacteria bacterium]